MAPRMPRIEVAARGNGTSYAPTAPMPWMKSEDLLRVIRERDEYILALRRDLAHLAQKIETFDKEPLLEGTIVEIDETEGQERMSVAFGPGNSMSIAPVDGASVGDRVLLHRQSMQAVKVIVQTTPTGAVVTAERVTELEDGGGWIVEAQMLGNTRAFRSSARVVKGERCVLDPSLSLVIGSLGGGAGTSRPATAIERVAWDDIGGQDEAKAALREAIELPLAHPELFAAYGKRAARGVLLWGPPGTGKTLLAKAAATAVAKLHGDGKAAATSFQYVKGPELLNAYIGRSEEAVRGVFAAARAHKAEHGCPAVVFIDECDALLGARDRGVNVSVNSTVVPQFLAEMDGLDDHAAMFILATNRPDLLDSAVVREGRVDRRVKVARPTRDDARAIFGVHFRGRPLAGTADHVGIAIDSIYADERVLRTFPVPGGEAVSVRLRDFASGAMFAGVVEHASTLAMQRDIARGGKTSGIEAADLAAAVDRAQASLGDMNLGEVLREIAEARSAA